jgi:hypothetical protein
MGTQHSNDGEGYFEINGKKYPLQKIDFSAFQFSYPVEAFTVSGHITLGSPIDELLDRRLLSAWVSVTTGLARVFNWDERQFRAEPYWVCLN